MEAAWVRLHEVICPNCQSDIMREGWGTRFLPLLRRDFSGCERCVDYIKALTRELGTPNLKVKAAPSFLDDNEQREFTAVHEAGHAVVGERLGIRMEFIKVGTEDQDIEGTSFQSNGRVRWEVDALQTVTVRDFVAMSLAGVQAEYRLLAERGLDTHPNRLELAFGGAGDALEIEKSVDGRWPLAEVRRDARRLTEGVITEHWGQITAVARAVLAKGQLNRDQIREAMNTAGHPSRPPEPVVQPSKSSKPNRIASISGGSVMSTIAEQARNALNIANEKATFVQGALQQAGLDIADIIAQLSLVTTDAESVQQAAGIYQQAKSSLEQLQGLVNSAVDTTQQYATQL
ncbi:hypothetical protein AB0L13_20245 [Saccharopolyspora shandongensis]|uniref:hypothetical protein n=1 Tax=Saccharopolyspora shandongensis TaxID=418495 RepID=UPI00344A0002